MAVHPELGSIKLSTVLSALSYALDLTEGHPRGHAARTCLIGMRVARALGLPAGEQSDLFYALLLKDAGCSSNAERVAQLFGGTDQEAKRAVWLRDWRKLRERIAYALERVEPTGTIGMRLRGLISLALRGKKESRRLFQVRCDRGADIARALGFSNTTQAAIRCMDEHWDGGGYPEGLRGEEIPLSGRIIGLAQVVEIFASESGPERALAVARDRRGRWFDPNLVDVLLEAVRDDEIWPSIATGDLQALVAAAEPIDRALGVDEARLDQIAVAFAWVIDAKSHFTYQHSDRVATAALEIGDRLGVAGAARVRLRRAGLLHDIGKLSVPNRILDKPGRLTEREWDAVWLHPYYTYRILERVPVFGELAYDASAHHEKLNGRGYYRNLCGDQLSRTARILAVADIYDALAADRPYRKGLPLEKVLAIIGEERGAALCPDCVDALRASVGAMPSVAVAFDTAF